MNGKIVIAKVDAKYILARIEGDRIMNIYAYDELIKQLVPGSIINGRISKRLEGIDASFVRVAKGFEGFINKGYKGESLLPVMYKKEASGDKKDLFTDRLSIKGEYTVCYDDNFGVKTSSKIKTINKKLLKEKFEAVAEEKNIGILIRTKCEGLSDLSPVYNEIERIASVIQKIRDTKDMRPEYTCFYQPLPPVIDDCIAMLRYCPEEIITDDRDVYDLLHENLEGYFGTGRISDRIRIRFYNDELLPLSKLYAFESKISESLSRIIYLKNGSFITFDGTEALTAIDVNSSSLSSKKANKEELILKVNKEAFEEIARHIYLRNISGIIIIDFINMQTKESYDELADYIRRILSEDSVKSQFHDFTALGLAEISRQKVRVNFREQMR